MNRSQPESARGTIGIRIATPMVSRAKPMWMSLLGRRFPALFPGEQRDANMVSESGASESPASSALYSSTICRKSGSAIISPPSAICCSDCAEMPMAEELELEEVRVDQRGLPWCLRRASQQPASPGHRADADHHTDPGPALLPDQDPEHDPAHADAERIAPTTSTCGRRCTGRPDQPHADQDDPDDHDLAEEPTRQERYVVMNPPSSGPTAAAIAAEAPTSA